MDTVRVVERGVERRRWWGRTELTHFELIADCAITDGRGTIRRTDDVRMRVPSAIADAVRLIIGAVDERLAGTRSLAELRDHVEAYALAPGFSASPFVSFLLRAATHLGVSDVHLEPGRERWSLRLRLHGRLHDAGTLAEGRARQVVGRLKVLAGLLAHRNDVVQEGRAVVSGTEMQVRVSVVPAVGGESLTVRLLDRRKGHAGFEDLGIDDDSRSKLVDALDAPGLVVFAGRSASGKTTTLYTALRHLVERGEGRLRAVTVEDPVEVNLPGVTQLEVDPARGNTYAELLKAVLRQDCHLLVVGEIRDPETATLAIRAALTGHKVLSTVHAGSPSEALVRMLELGIPASRLASAVGAIAVQELVPEPCTDHGGERCPHCVGGVRGRRPRMVVRAMGPGVRAALTDVVGVDELGAVWDADVVEMQP